LFVSIFNTIKFLTRFSKIEFWVKKKKAKEMNPERLKTITDNFGTVGTKKLFASAL